jgi:hypothetical protein
MSIYAHHVPSDPDKAERQRRQKLDDQLKAIEGAQATVANWLGVWLRADQHPEGAKQAERAWKAMDDARRQENELFLELFLSRGVHGEQQKTITRR